MRILDQKVFQETVACELKPEKKVGVNLASRGQGIPDEESTVRKHGHEQQGNLENWKYFDIVLPYNQSSLLALPTPSPTPLLCTWPTITQCSLCHAAVLPGPREPQAHPHFRLSAPCAHTSEKALVLKAAHRCPRSSGSQSGSTSRQRPRLILLSSVRSTVNVSPVQTWTNKGAGRRTNHGHRCQVKLLEWPCRRRFSVSVTLRLKAVSDVTSLPICTCGTNVWKVGGAIFFCPVLFIYF